MKKLSGVITVFMSLVLLMVLSILFTLLESARSEALKLKSQMIANLAIESTFASYDTHLFEKYGLLYFAGKDSGGDEFSDIVLDYAKMNTGEESFGKSWLRLKSDSVSVLNYVAATDKNGEVFINSVCEYMRGAGLIETAGSAVKDLISGSQADDTSLAVNDDDEIDLSKVKDSVQDNEDEINDSEQSDDEIEVENKEELEEEYEESKDNLKNWISKGVLSLVCDNASEISDASYDLDGAPSSLSDETKERDVCDIESPSEADLLLFDEFVFNSFNHYKKDEDGRLEIEYIICGKESDLSNLSSIAKRIVAVRLGIDYVKIRKDTTKTAEAYAIGTAVAGWTGIPSLVTAVKESVLIIWALSDAIDDTKEIFAGEKDDNGLSYEGYLRAFLLLKSNEDKAYRTMDVIQWTITEEEKAFRFKNCIYAARISLNLTGEKLFPLLPAPISYSYSMETAYSYGEVTKYK